tara:strand:+ start:180 stop:506 length:327 start_codon:yes stop_codon:yes gene_type:complete
MQVIGKLVKKLDRETGVSKSGKGWEKQSVVIEQNGKDFNKEVVVSFFGDKVKKLRDINEGSEVNVSVNLSSREYNGKYYHNIDGWFISNIGEETVGGKFMTSDDEMPF